MFERIVFLIMMLAIMFAPVVAIFTIDNVEFEEKEYSILEPKANSNQYIAEYYSEYALGEGEASNNDIDTTGTVSSQASSGYSVSSSISTTSDTSSNVETTTSTSSSNTESTSNDKPEEETDNNIDDVESDTDSDETGDKPTLPSKTSIGGDDEFAIPFEDDGDPNVFISSGVTVDLNKPTREIPITPTPMESKRKSKIPRVNDE